MEPSVSPTFVPSMPSSHSLSDVPSSEPSSSSDNNGGYGVLHTGGVDRDGDGVSDTEDTFPNNLFENANGDGDKIGDNTDIFPSNPTEWHDTDWSW